MSRGLFSAFIDDDLGHLTSRGGLYDVVSTRRIKKPTGKGWATPTRLTWNYVGFLPDAVESVRTPWREGHEAGVRKPYRPQLPSREA